jgi:hypothetical protein
MQLRQGRKTALLIDRRRISEASDAWLHGLRTRARIETQHQQRFARAGAQVAGREHVAASCREVVVDRRIADVNGAASRDERHQHE